MEANSPLTPFVVNYDYQIPHFVKILLYVFGGLTCLAIIFYVSTISLGERHRFDKNRAMDQVQSTKKVLSPKNDKTISPKELDTLHNDIAKALINCDCTINLDHFATIGRGDSTLVINYAASDADVLIKKLSSLPDTSFRKREDMIDFVQKNVGSAWSKYDFDEFINQNNFWNNAETTSRLLLMITAIVFATLLAFAFSSIGKQRGRQERKAQYVVALETSADITQSWVSAQTTLDTYHRRNLDQNNWTFWFSVIVMAIGFGIIIYGIHSAITLNTLSKGIKGSNDGSTLITIVSTASGVIINLIGGTFLAIYNSTLKQAIDYTNSLQKTSTVGTSLAILKSIEDDNKSQ